MFLPRLAACAFVALTIASCSTNTVEPVQACGEYFDAKIRLFKDCGLLLADDGYAHARTRFLAACNVALHEPGTGFTTESLIVCAAGLKWDWCSNFANDPACGTPTGTIESGKPCESHAQCQTGICGAPGEGGSCGTCSPVIPVGGACISGGPPCTKSAVCVPRASGPAGTCMAVVFSEIGASCGDNIRCKSGVCDATSRTCVLPGPLGIALGAACTADTPCAPGFFCNSATRKCEDLQLVKPGGPCTISGTRCAIGVCNGTCPQVLADGAACIPDNAATTCDLYAECKGHVCVVENFSSCK